MGDRIPFRKTRFSPIMLGIGSRDLHLSQLRETNGEITLLAADSIPIPKQSDRGKVLPPRIREALRSGQFKGRQVAICLKGEDLFIQHQRITQGGRSEVEKRIREEFRQNVPFNIEDAEIRYLNSGKVYERSGLQNELIIMIADRSVINGYLSMMEALDLTTVMIGLEPLAMMRALLHFPPAGLPEEGVTGFLSIGTTRSELIIIRDRFMVFTRSITVGGENLVQAISRKLGIPENNALRLKKAISLGQPLNDTLLKAAGSAFRPVVEKISTEISSCFRYFSSVYNREAVDRLIIAGEEVGGILQPKRLEEQIGVPVSAWDLKSIPGVDGLSARGRVDTGFISLIGQAVEVLEPSEGKIDFMPDEVLHHRHKKKSLTFKIAAVTALLLVLGVLYFSTYQRRQKLEQMHQMMESRTNMLQVKNETYLSLAEEESRLQEKRELLLQIRPVVRISRVIGEIARACGTDIHFRHFSLNGLGERGNQDGRYLLIRIEGLARSEIALTAFDASLSRSGAFSSIRHEELEDMVSDDEILKSFTLTLTVGGEVQREIF